MARTGVVRMLSCCPYFRPLLSSYSSPVCVLSSTISNQQSNKLKIYLAHSQNPHCFSTHSLPGLSQLKSQTNNFISRQSGALRYPHNKYSFSPSDRLLTWNSEFSRTFKTKASQGHASNLPDSEKDDHELMLDVKHEQDMLEADARWLMRLSTENNYLSWCRNVYISTIAGATVYGQILIVPYGKEAGIILFLMGGLNMLAGTSDYVYNLLQLQDKILMRRTTILFRSSYAVVHMLLWFGCIAIYVGYVDEEDMEEARLEVEKEWEQHEQERRRTNCQKFEKSMENYQLEYWCIKFHRMVSSGSLTI